VKPWAGNYLPILLHCPEIFCPAQIWTRVKSAIQIPLNADRFGIKLKEIKVSPTCGPVGGNFSLMGCNGAGFLPALG
jgi:hypothetical protein